DAWIHTAVEQRLSADYPGPWHWQRVAQGVGGVLWRVQSPDAAWCVKTIADDPQRLFAEADGLRALGECGAVRVPQVLATAQQDGSAYLLMEWLELGPGTPLAAARLGEELARQHRCLGKRFGWRRDNFIGATPQFNALADDWLGFFRARRLGFQLRLAAENGYHGEVQTQGARLLEKLPVFFTSYTPQPSLLHGDLWSGNWGVLSSGVPVIFDPAVYWGDREAELAMTELLGGFSPEFYSAYNSAWPLDAGYRTRRDLYMLYHILNHLNLFGGAYLSQAQQLMTRLEAAVR
ncbi:MAG: fructosamine kinase family protein, partial [Gammaproteobacteria bacterium]